MQAITTVGVDIAKSVFQVHGIDGEGRVVIRRYERALDLSREQHAKTFELRAAMSLARLWAERGERQRAHDLLATIYGWFTEGFGTRDLIEAKALLDVLR
jgi:predicted ATPase